MKKIITTILALSIIGAMLGAAGSALYLHNRLYPNTFIAGVPVGGLTKDEARKLLEQAISKKKKESIALLYENSEWKLNLRRLKYAPRPNITINKAYGRRSYKTIFKNRLALPLDFTLDSDSLETKIATISAEISFPAQDPELKIDAQSKKISALPGQNGRELNIDDLLAQINRNLSNLAFSPIRLQVRQVSVNATADRLEKTRRPNRPLALCWTGWFTRSRGH